MYNHLSKVNFKLFQDLLSIGCPKLIFPFSGVGEGVEGGVSG